MRSTRTRNSSPLAAPRSSSTATEPSGTSASVLNNTTTLPDHAKNAHISVRLALLPRDARDVQKTESTHPLASARRVLTSTTARTQSAR